MLLLCVILVMVTWCLNYELNFSASLQPSDFVTVYWMLWLIYYKGFEFCYLRLKCAPFCTRRL